MTGGRYRWSRDHIIVGTKPTMNYVVACITLFNSGMSSLSVRARGRNISKAVEVVEMLRRVFVKDAEVDDIKLGTDVHTPSHGKEVSVSTIEIVVKNSKAG
jgi:DNA-binding protein